MASNEQLRMVEELAAFFTLPQSEKAEMATKIRLLCDALMGSAGKSIVSSNSDVYKYLISESILTGLYIDKNEPYMQQIMSNSSATASVFSSKAKQRELVNLAQPEIGVRQLKVVSTLSAVNAMKSFVAFNAESSIPQDRLDEVAMQADAGEEDLNLMAAFGGSDLFDEFDEGAVEPESPESEIDFDESDFEENTSDEFEGLLAEEDQAEIEVEELYIEEPVVEEPVVVSEKQPEEEQTTSISEKEAQYIKEIKEAWGRSASACATDIMKELEPIYKPGYQGLGNPVGIMTKKETFRTSSNHGKSEVLGDMIIASNLMKVYKLLMESIGSTYDSEDVHEKIDDPNFVTLKYLMENVHSAVFYWFHVRMLYGHMRTCTAIRRTPSLRSFVKKMSNAPKNIDTIAKISEYQFMNDWGHQIIEDLLCDFYVESGISPRELDDAGKVDRINSIVKAAIMNVVVASEFQCSSDGTAVYATILVGRATHINSDECVKQLKARMKTENSANSDIQNMESGTSSTAAIKVIYDVEKESANRLFAHQTLGGIIESGESPRWDHALLGRKLSGQPLFWDDFMDAAPKKRVICIYGASRSGKGVMTSTLLTNALASGLKIMYVDGKPENGAGLGRLAWSQGKEAACFNGQDQNSPQYGSTTIERLSFGVRPSNIYDDTISKLPKGLFRPGKSAVSAEQFAKLNTYLRGIDLMLHIIRRSSFTDKSTWSLFVIDEVQSMASLELTVRQEFDELFKLKCPRGTKTRKILGMEVPILPDFEDEADFGDVTSNSKELPPDVVFAAQWSEWLKDMSKRVRDALVINMGGSNVNVLMLFQTTEWMRKLSNTFLSDMVTKLSSATKIIGGSSMIEDSGDAAFGNKSFEKENSKAGGWTSKIGGGKWALTSGERTAVHTLTSNSDVSLFRPFDLFLEPYPGQENKPGVNPEMYLDAYTKKLFAAVRPGGSAAEVLEEGFNYFNSRSQELFNMSLLDFMYNAHSSCIPVNQIQLDGAAEDEGDKTQQVPVNDSAANNERNSEEQVYQVPNSKLYQSADGMWHDVGEDGIVGTEDDEEIDFGNNPKDNVVQFNSGPTRKFNPSVTPTPVPVQPAVARAPEYMPGFGPPEAPLSAAEQKFVNQSKYHQVALDNRRQGVGSAWTNQNVDVGVEGFGDLERGSAEATEDFTTAANVSYALDPSMIEPDVGQYSEEQAFSNAGRNGRTNNIFSFPTNLAQTLDSTNSIVVDIDDREPLETRNNLLFKSLWGTRYQFKKRWERILKAVGKKINPNMVHKIWMCGNTMMVNDHIVDMDNILGGYENINLYNIADFPMLFKAFPNIDELVIDSELLEMAQMNNQNMPEQFFHLGKSNRVRRVSIIQPNGKKVTLNRADLKRSKSIMKDISADQDIRARLNVACQARGGRSRAEAGIAHTDRIWASAKNLSDKGLGGAYDLVMRERPAMIRGVLMTAVGLGAIAVGGIAYGIGGIFRLFSR
jgi:hypothetical protein